MKKIYFDNNLYNIPSIDFLLANEHLISKSYYVRCFYEEYGNIHPKSKPSLSIKQIFDAYPNLELENLNYFNVVDTKDTIFDSLLPYLKKINSLPESVSNILSRYDFSEQEVLAQLQTGFNINLADIKYRDCFYYYYANREFTQDIPWLKSIIKILLMGENTALENYFEIMGLSKHSDIIADQALLENLIREFPNCSTIEENILCISLIQNQRLANKDILDKIIYFFENLKGASYIGELKYYLKLTLADYVHKNYSLDMCSYFISKTYVDYFDISVLKDIIPIQSDHYNKMIAPLAKDNFYLFLMYFQDNEAYGPISEFIENGFSQIENEDWEMSELFSDYLANKDLKYYINPQLFIQNIIGPKFKLGNDILKCRLLPILAKLSPESDIFDQEIIEIKYDLLPNQEQKYLFRYLNGKNISKPLFQYLIKLLKSMILRSKTCTKKYSKIAGYNNICFETDLNNFKNVNLFRLNDLEQLIMEEPDFIEKKLGGLDFFNYFDDLTSYFLFLKKYFKNKVIVKHFVYLTLSKNIEAKVNFYQIAELSNLHEKQQLIMSDTDYIRLASRLESFSNWKKLFPHNSKIQNFFKINYEFKKKLTM